MTATEVMEREEAPAAMQSHTPASDPMMVMIERILMNPEIPMDRVSAMMDMQERQMSKAAEQAFNRDFSAAMAEMPDVPKSGHNKHSGQRYSTIDDLIRTSRPVLAKHGLSLTWGSVVSGNEITTTAYVRHSLGHTIQTSFSGNRDTGKQMNVLQGGASTETYLRRYTGFAILGLSSGDAVDDDGQSSQQSKTPITEEQYLELRDMIEAAGITEEIVCSAEGFKMLPEMPANMFARVKRELQTTISNNAKEKDGEVAA